jgi:hypothetical protein
MTTSSETSPLLPTSTSPSPAHHSKMKRSSTFVSPARRKLLEHEHAKLDENEVHGPIPWLNPTRALFTLKSPSGGPSASDSKFLLACLAHSQSSRSVLWSNVGGEESVTVRSRSENAFKGMGWLARSPSIKRSCRWFCNLHQRIILSTNLENAPTVPSLFNIC